MARRRAHRDPITGDLDKPIVEEPDNTTTDWLIEHLKKGVCSQGKIYSLSEMAMLPAVKQDGGYHTAKYNAGDEFELVGLRQGARKQLIFEFKPLDPEHKQVEADEAKVFPKFRELQKDLVEAMGFQWDSGRLARDAGDRGNIESFASGKWRWIREEAVRRKDRKGVGAKIAAIVTADNLKRDEDNPDWGMF